MVFILIILFYIIIGFVFYFDEDFECIMNFMVYSLFNFFYWIVYINNVVNFFIYGLFDEWFCGILWRMFIFIFFLLFKIVKKSLLFVVLFFDFVDEKNVVVISVVFENYVSKEVISVVFGNSEKKSIEIDIG